MPLDEIGLKARFEVDGEKKVERALDDINKRRGCGCSITEETQASGNVANILLIMFLIGLPFIFRKRLAAREKQRNN